MSKTDGKTETATFTLPNRKVKVVPIKRRKGLVPPEHEASFLFKESYFEVCVPQDQYGRLKDPLSPEERAFLESPASGLDFYPGELLATKKNSYWLTKAGKVKLKNEILYLDLSRADDFMKYKILLANPDRVAPSADVMTHKLTYKFAIVDVDHETRQQVNELDIKLRAYTAYGAVQNDSKKLRHILMVAKGIRVARTSKLGFLQAEMNKILNSEPETFLNTINDKNLETKILIEEAIQAKALKKDGIAYATPGGDDIGRNVTEAIEFLNNPKNQDIRIVIENRVDEYMSD